ncbi:Carbonic anhydrase [Colletotrichum orbiculare MAFF 240422]|uniref:Carbonic anhydrase n=1 Tax=Colletotrichum orbiculare (strain 104-T / ATCC 96160 / CBS 514.97 / LARS 414 / MAFF 240422) TaxID=1213857 RepID=N4VZW7_COLOR|nr:Carbonic anhydrase [Colletotrichum orbiculare MAFF 240422]
MKSTAILSLIPAVSAFCDHGTSLFKRAEGTFGFDGMNGPLNWHTLTPNNSACALGKNQSPINVVQSNTKQVQGSTITFAVEDHPEGADLENLAGFLEVRANGTMKNGGKDFTLRQFHFHTPSEHRINGEHFPLEVHFVWESQAGNGTSLAVVGFPIEVAETSNPLLAAVFKNIDQVKEVGSHAVTGPLDFSSLATHLSQNTIYQYSGSLTTPPCTENIAWNVVGPPITIDLATYKKTKNIMKFNSRYTQNNPGETNLLENAMVSLNKIVGQGSEAAPKPTTEYATESPCKKGNKNDGKGSYM